MKQLGQHCATLCISTRETSSTYYKQTWVSCFDTHMKIHQSLVSTGGFFFFSQSKPKYKSAFTIYTVWINFQMAWIGALIKIHSSHQ